MARSHTTKNLEYRVQQAIQAAASSIIAGEAKSLDSYREMCGYIRGLSEAIEILNEIEAEYASERDRPGTSH